MAQARSDYSADTFPPVSTVKGDNADKTLYPVYPVEADIIGSLTIPALNRKLPILQGTVIVPTDHAVLTLTTCYPFNTPGYSPDRYIVSAALLEH